MTRKVRSLPRIRACRNVSVMTDFQVAFQFGVNCTMRCAVFAKNCIMNHAIRADIRWFRALIEGGCVFFKQMLHLFKNIYNIYNYIL